MTLICSCNNSNNNDDNDDDGNDDDDNNYNNKYNYDKYMKDIKHHHQLGKKSVPQMGFEPTTLRDLVWML